MRLIEVKQCINIASNREGCVSCHSINPDPKFKPFDVLMDEVFGMYRVLMCLSAK